MPTVCSYWLQLCSEPLNFLHSVFRLGTQPKIRPAQCTAEQRMTWRKTFLSPLSGAPQRAGVSQDIDANAQSYPLERYSISVVMLWTFACMDSEPAAIRQFDSSAGGKLLLRRLQTDRSAASAVLHAAQKTLTLRCACLSYSMEVLTATSPDAVAKSLQ